MIASHHKDKQFPFHKLQIIIETGVAATLICIILYRMYYIALDNNLGVSPSYFGMRDSHDIQWEAFRSNFLLMLSLALIWRYVGSKKHPSILGLGLIVLMFKADVILYFGVILLSYGFSLTFYKNKRFQLMKWIFVVSTLAVIEYFNRFRSFSSWMSAYVPIEVMKNQKHLIEWASIINMSLLKMLSFGVDIHRCHFDKQQLQKHKSKCKSCLQKSPCLRARDMFPSAQPTFINYLDYILFPGTLLAGPPISYNNFHSFKIAPMDCESPILRFALNFVSFQIFQLLFPVMKLNEQMSLIELSISMLLALMFIWYKFNIIWKWAKVWSYLQGIQVIDNMNRCVINNYGFEGFWRMWHRGFNMWLIRYMYVPLGGNKSVIKSYLCVFLFVAFWHDPQLKLLVWAVIILIFIIPEVITKKIVRQKYSHLFQKFWFKYLSAFAGAIYVFTMVFSNIIGFGWGFSGVYLMLEKFKSQFWSLIFAIGFTTVVINLMFFIRFMEKQDYGY